MNKYDFSQATISVKIGVRCSSVVRAFAHSAMGRQIDPSWGGPIELFLVLSALLNKTFPSFL